LISYSSTETSDNITSENIRQFVESQGIVVLFQQLSPGIRGSTFKKKGIQYIIVNANDPPERQNFTIAHEYCEIQLESNKDLSLDERHQLANTMAGELLLPTAEFEPAAALTSDLHTLKRCSRVSVMKLLRADWFAVNRLWFQF